MKESRAVGSPLLLIETLKKAATVLRDEGLPFALAGGAAVYARGGALPRLSGHQDMQAVLDRAEEISVAAVPMPVLTATDLVIAWLASFTEHHADFALALTCVRPVREQMDWGRVRAETAGSAFAAAFLVLLRELRVLTGEEENDEGRHLRGGPGRARAAWRPPHP